MKFVRCFKDRSRRETFAAWSTGEVTCAKRRISTHRHLRSKKIELVELAACSGRQRAAMMRLRCSHGRAVGFGSYVCTLRLKRDPSFLIRLEKACKINRFN